MRAKLITSLVVLVAVVTIVAAESPAAVDSEIRLVPKVLFFNAETPSSKGSVTTIPCGSQLSYNATDDGAPVAKAYLNRAVAEPLSCATDFKYPVKKTFMALGSAEIYFPLGCELIGVIQSKETIVDLPSVHAEILKNDAPIATGNGYVAADNGVGICEGNVPSQPPAFHVGIVTNDLGSKGQFQAGDMLTARLTVKAVNTEPAILKYWFLQTGGSLSAGSISNITLHVEPSPDETTTPPTSEPTSTTTPATGDSPACARDIPQGEHVTKEQGESFNLQAVCQDPNDDLDHATWTVDASDVGSEPLGASPDTVNRTFTMPDDQCHTIAVTPTDQAGHVGSPATWTVCPPGVTPTPTTTTTTPPSPDAPSCTRDVPADERVTKDQGESFNLQAVCRDPNDDLDHANWTIDGDDVGGEPLGSSPDTVNRTFRLDDDQCHTIAVTPTDQAGHVGSAATWTVCPPGVTPTPTTSASVPFFPSTAGWALGLLGALGGALIVLRRRP